MTLRRLYLDASARLPVSWRAWLESLPLPLFGWLERQRLRTAIRSGPPYRPSHGRIVVDLTTACDVGCLDCNRSCGARQAPAQEHLSLAQLQRFLDESLAQGRRWRVIQLEGGEPTLHPQFHDIVERLDAYRRRHAPATVIKVISNGVGETTRAALAALPRAVDRYITDKRGRIQDSHCAFNVAPVDLPELRGTDFSSGCFLPAHEGLGLTRHGYYPHPVCAGIDRVWGFDVGRRTLPRPDDDLREQFARLCPLCGLFRFFRGRGRARPDLSPDQRERGLRGTISPSWVHAYDRYREKRPVLTLYGPTAT
jgi:hypothetical protein